MVSLLRAYKYVQRPDALLLFTLLVVPRSSADPCSPSAQRLGSCSALATL